MHVISYRHGEGRMAVVTAESDDRDELDGLCTELARQVSTVVLHTIVNGTIVPVTRFEKDGSQTTSASQTIPGAIAILEGSTTKVVVPSGNEEVDITLDPTDSAADEEEKVYDYYCVKCKAHRQAVGHVEISAAGRRMAKGICPVCGTKLNRILSNLPAAEQDSYETPDDEPEEAAAESETPSVAVPEFSDTKPETKAKRVRKAKDVPQIPAEAAEFQTVGVCPKCHQKVAGKDTGGLFVLIAHEGEGKPECSGSRMAL